MSQDTHEDKPVVPTDENRSTHEETNNAPQDTDLSKKEGDIDYKAMYEAELETRQKAEKKIVKLKTKQKKSPEPQYEEEGDDEEETPDISEIVAREVAKQSALSNVDSVIAKYTSNPDKQKLIKLHLDNIRPSGDISTDVRRAVLLADEPIFSKMSEERKAMEMSKMGTSNQVSTGSEIPSKTPEKEVGQRAKQTAINNLPPRYRKHFNQK